VLAQGLRREVASGARSFRGAPQDSLSNLMASLEEQELRRGVASEEDDSFYG